MKFSKLLVVVLSLISVCGVIFAAKVSYNIQADLGNAIQHIGSVRLLNGSQGILIKEQKNNVNISDISNFLVSGNTIELSEDSSVLGGRGNRVLGSSYNAGKLTASTIVAGIGNKVESDYSVINGGEGNIIGFGSDNSVIMGGKGNIISSYSESSTIVGGYGNVIDGKNSTVAGVSSTVEGDNSVALGSNVAVEGNNSFFWSDGSTPRKLTGDGVFVVISENGMVINTGIAHPGAQLTVNGSLIVSQKTGVDIMCGSGDGKGIMKLIDKEDENNPQKCLCSCDGWGWHSLVGNGKCESVCNGTNQEQPKCGSGLIVTRNSVSDPWTYLGTCEKGFPIDDSYIVIRYSSGDIIGDRVLWTCQENNGNVAYSGCEYIIKCEGSIPANAHRNNNIVPSLDPSVNRNYKFADDPSVLCSYSCNDGYLWMGGSCKEICNKSEGRCYIGSVTYPATQRTQNYNYLCEYTYNNGSHSYSCDMKCPDGQVWAGGDRKCVSKETACGSEKYTCSLGTPSKTLMDEEDRVGKDFTWKCLDGSGTPIWVCSKAKPRVDKDVYFNVNTAGTIETAWFTINGSITSAINIKLPYSTANGGNVVDGFVINANAQTSETKSYDSSFGNITLNWPIFENDEIPQGEIVYKLKVVDGDINNYCAGSCSMAGQCLYTATSSAYNSSINGNRISFTWKCTAPGKSPQSCSASCPINTSSCNAVPSGATACDATAESDCIPLSSQTSTINKDNFYMYSTEEVISSSICGTKRHCVKGTSGYVSYTIETHHSKSDGSECKQSGFRCNDGKILSGCACVDICNGAGGCNGGAVVELPGATRETGYNYTCTLGSSIYNCSANCPTGKYWNGTSCVSAPAVCDGTHYDCKNGASMGGNVHLTGSHIYKWKCTLGDIQKQCLDCETNYVLSGTVCIPVTIPCEKNDNLDGYKVPAMNNGESQPVAKTDSVQKCTNTATCTNGTLTLGTDNCTVACKTDVNPGTCNLNSPTNYAGTKWGYTYTYNCGDFGCGVTCANGKIWNGSKCVDKVDPCGSTAKECIQGTYKKVLSDDTGDTWHCVDEAKPTKANLDASFNGICYKCKSGYARNGSKCAKSCKTADNYDWANGSVGTVYKDSEYKCSNTCDSNTINVKCDDGSFFYNTSPYEKVTISVYNDCTTKDSNPCDTTEFPLISQNVDHAATYNECVYYTYTNGMCNGNYRYSVKTCEGGYSWNGYTCLKDIEPEPVVINVDGECGSSYQASQRCSRGSRSDYNSLSSEYKTWKCVGEGSGATVTCTYSCTTTTVGGTPGSCPDGYELDGSTCRFVGFKYCAEKLCTCSNGRPCACAVGGVGDGASDRCSSYTCFGDSSQAAGQSNWPLCQRPDLSLDSTSYNNYELSAESFGVVYGLRKYSPKTTVTHCAEDQIDTSNCTELEHYTVASYDNGYYLKGCSNVPATKTPCGGTSGTSTTTCKVTQLGSCFPAGTMIVMADGSMKQIEDVVENDEVVSYNEKSGMIEPNKAKPIIHENSSDEMYELTIDGKVLKVTYSHRFYVVAPNDTDGYQCSISYDWIAASDLKVGDRLFMLNGSYGILQNIEHYPNVETVYNLEVENNHNYFVDDGYLVHNRKIDGATPLLP